MFWNSWKSLTHVTAYNVADTVKIHCWFSFFWKFASFLTSFLSFRLQFCLSLVSRANSQRRGRQRAWITSNTHQTLQPEDRQEPWNSKVCHCLSSKKTKQKKVSEQTGVRQVGKGCKLIYRPFFFFFFCKNVALLRHVWRQINRGGKMRRSNLVSSGYSGLIHLQASFLFLHGNYEKLHMPIFQEKRLFQWMKIDFPLNLCIIKKQKQWNRVLSVAFLCSFLTFYRGVFSLNVLWMKRTKWWSMLLSCAPMCHFVADFCFQDIFANEGCSKTKESKWGREKNWLSIYFKLDL